MLHCYILSRVKLHPEDIARVSAAYRAQLKVISQLEDKVDLHTRLAEHYMKEMRKIRENEILPMLEAMLSEGYGDTEFLDTLQKDLLKAENVIRSEVAVLFCFHGCPPTRVSFRHWDHKGLMNCDNFLERRVQSTIVIKAHVHDNKFAAYQNLFR